MNGQKPPTEQTVYLVKEHNDLSQFEPVENADVIQRWYSQNGYSELLPEHAAGGATQATKEPGHEPPGPSTPPQPTVTYVTQQGQQEEKGGTFIGSADYTCHCLSVNWVRGEEQASQ